MCGIVGYIGTQDAAPILLEGLGRLEYRGYDSAGLAVVTRSGLKIHKSQGRVADAPPRLADLMERTERVDGLTNDVTALKGLIDERMAALRQPRAARR